MMRTALRVLGSLWQLPAAVPIWLVYILPLWALGLLRCSPIAGARWSLGFVAQFPHTHSWWTRRWTGWAGHTVPFAIVVRELMPMPPQRVLAHELRHAEQWRMLGPLFPIVYGLLLEAYGYRDHPLEIDADRHAEAAWARRG